MLGIFADSFKIATRTQKWDGADNEDKHGEVLRQHEIRKREELHRQREQQKLFC